MVKRSTPARPGGEKRAPRVVLLAADLRRLRACWRPYGDQFWALYNFAAHIARRIDAPPQKRGKRRGRKP